MTDRTASHDRDANSTPEQVLARYWGYDAFRPCQREIIGSVLDGHDTLGLLPTGGGKSITFQVPALMLPGLTIVVTPLVSLMKDQVDNLRSHGITAVYLYSGLTRREVTLAYDRCRLGKAKMLYVSPERLRSQKFMDELRLWQVSLIVVDEAHCISQWGYDFRPSYLKIIDLRKAVGASVPVLALTASATPVVRDDIMSRLGFGSDARVFTLTFDRNNLSYIVRLTPDKYGKLLEVLRNVPGTAIVYVRSRVKCREIAAALTAAGISAAYYHAGLEPQEKSERQEAWKDGNVRVMVATNAFGMGIDKPDVRLVVHMDVPPSLEEYYQEAGRAGRDGLHSFAVILAGSSDKAMLTRRLDEAFPPKDYIRRVYELLGNFLDVSVGEGYNMVYEFDLGKFCAMFSLRVQNVRGALAILCQSGYIEFIDEAPTRSRVMMICRREELYDVSLAPDTEKVLLSLMRLYTGLFSDYVFISESAIARATGVTEDEVYQAMLALGRHGILHYVPRKAIPYIYYTTSREEPRHIKIPRTVYNDRRALMEKRLNAVRAFVFSDDRCRSQILLNYFGEDDAPVCGRCDVCRSRRMHERIAAAHPAMPREAIIGILQRHPSMTIDAMQQSLRITAADLLPHLRALVEDGTLTQSATSFSLRKQ